MAYLYDQLITYVELFILSAADFLTLFTVQRVTAGKGISVRLVVLAPIDTMTGVSFHLL